MAELHPFIRCRGLTKTYGGSRDAPAVRDVALDIESGTRLGVVGRNGAGKSTLLHVLAGIATASSGMLKVQGKVTSVFTLGVGLREDLTGRENIVIDGKLQGLSALEIQRQLQAIIDFAELGNFIDRPVRTYSTGMKARLGFAMISSLEPEILIIDEALSAGDAVFGRKASRRIRELCMGGKIVIIVSHSMGAIRDLCNRCIWMDAGSVVMDGEPTVVTQAYLDVVRREDSQSLAKRFPLPSVQSDRPGWEIRDLGISCGAGLVFRMERMARPEIFANVKIPGAEPDAAVQLRVTRLDGLVIIEETKKVASLASKHEGGAAVLRVDLGRLRFGPAIYRLDVGLLAGRDVAARGSVEFEVYSERTVSGGRPALSYEFEATITREETV